ncbi:odorant receptor 49b-like [Diorhabda sublineata]|nr:odorant receptor 49b-like [Diorhabda sublineata]
MMCTTAVSASVLTPMLHKSEDIESRFPLRLWYPFKLDFAASPTYELVYIHHASLVVYSTLNNIFLEIIVAAFTTFVGAQCDLICHNMETATDLKMLKRFIFHHQSIVDFAKRAEDVVTEMYLFQFGATTISVCMTLFLLSVVDKHSFEFFFFTMFNFGITLQLLLPCWFSTQMESKSQKIPFCVYSLPWQDAPNHLKKDVCFFLSTTQEFIILRVMNMFTLSVDTYVKILKSSFSYYTVLNSFKGED